MSDWAAQFLPCTRAMVERLRAADPAYGSQLHQRQWCERMDVLQRMFPCPQDHEHTAGSRIIGSKAIYGCYTRQQDDEAARVIRARAT